MSFCNDYDEDDNDDDGTILNKSITHPSPFSSFSIDDYNQKHPDRVWMQNNQPHNWIKQTPPIEEKFNWGKWCIYQINIKKRSFILFKTNKTQEMRREEKRSDELTHLLMKL